VISLKKYLDLPAHEDLPVEAEVGAASSTVIDCYRAILLAMGRSAIHGCPAVGQSLDVDLRKIADRLSADLPADILNQMEAEVEARLQKWGARTEQHLKHRAEDAKQLMIVLAETAEAVGGRDEKHADRLRNLTDKLQKIGDLEDLSEIRASLVENVAELKLSVEHITQQSQQMLAHLRVKLSSYEHKLKEAELLVLRDELTGMANRRSVEERIQLNIANGIKFCVLMIDLDGFKQVNDTYGHQAGDELLKQFAAELSNRSRISDLVGRWGGDEFIVVHENELATAIPFMLRIEEWVFGKYNLHSSGSSRSKTVEVTASIGVAEWQPGELLQQVIARADEDMYVKKHNARAARGLKPARESEEVGQAAAIK